MIIGIIIGLMIAVASILLILSGLVNEMIFKRLGSKRPYLAWIPIASYYELAVLTRDEYDKNKFFTIDIDNKYFKFWPALQGLVGIVPYVGSLLSLAITIGCLGTTYTRVYAMMENGKTKDYTGIGYVSGLIPIIPVIKYFKLLEQDQPSMYSKAQYEGYDINQQFNQMQQDYNEAMNYNYNQNQGQQVYNQQQNMQGYEPQMQQGYNQQMQAGYNQQAMYNQQMQQNQNSAVIRPRQVQQENLQIYDENPVVNEDNIAEEIEVDMDMF